MEEEKEAREYKELTLMDLMPIAYIKAEPFFGSLCGMRFMLAKKKVDDETTVLSVFTWPEPNCFAATPDEDKHSAEFPFNEEGRQKSLEWLNKELPLFRKS